MISRLLLLAGIFCLPHKTAGFWSWTDGYSTANDIVLPEEIALVVIAETNRTDAYCSVQEHKLIQDRLMAGVRYDDDDSSDDSDDRRKLQLSRAQCALKCSGFRLGLKDSHCWLINPSCENYARRATTEEGKEQATSPTVRGNTRARELGYDKSDFGKGFVGSNGKWKSWNEVSSDAHAKCLEEKYKIDRALPFLQYERALSSPCKLLMKNHFEVGCLDISK